MSSSDRRSDDTRIAQIAGDVTHLHGCVESLKKAVAENTEITQQVRDILATFKVTMAIAKWIAAIGVAAGVCVAFFRSLKGG